LKQAFHPTASMKFVSDEGYKEVNAVEFFQGVMKPGPRQSRQTHIVDINVSGNAASARVEAVYPTFKFIDYMNLLNIDGEWKIVSKIFYREEAPKP
ncbi:MAG: nuclear transport factor 2 family protein, partial [Cyclobacteriaceae bacterium]